MGVVFPPLQFHNNFSLSLPGHLEVVKLLVSRSADAMCKDKRGYTPLHAAASNGQIEVVKYLLRLGAEVRGAGGGEAHNRRHVPAGAC